MGSEQRAELSRKAGLKKLTSQFNRVGQIDYNVFWLPELCSPQMLEPTEGRGQPRTWMMIWVTMAAQQLPPAALFWQLVMSLQYKNTCLEVLNSSPWTKFTGWIQTLCAHTYSRTSLWLPIRYKDWAGPVVVSLRESTSLPKLDYNKLRGQARTSSGALLYSQIKTILSKWKSGYEELQKEV